MSDASSICDVLLANYKTARAEIAAEQYSASWTKGHYQEFQKIVSVPAYWENFQCNGIADGMSGAPGFTDGKPKLDPEIRDPEQREQHIAFFNKICDTAGADFVRRYAATTIGNPSHVIHEGSPIIYQDIRLIYSTWRLSELLKHRINDELLIVDIGGGHGGLAEKLKQLFPNSHVVLIDLPEANAIQTYYLKTACPDSRVLGLNDLNAADSQFFTRPEFDFAALPPSCAEALPKNAVDLFINLRSFQEINPGVIKSYFDIIHNSCRTGGMFYCVNRYCKTEVGVPVCFKDYPYDDHWDTVRSAPMWEQYVCHELAVVRTDRPSSLAPAGFLKNLPPYRLSNIFGDLKCASSKIRAMIGGVKSGLGNPGIIRILSGRGEGPSDPIRALRRLVGRLVRKIRH